MNNNVWILINLPKTFINRKRQRIRRQIATIHSNQILSMLFFQSEGFVLNTFQSERSWPSYFATRRLLDHGNAQREFVGAQSSPTTTRKFKQPKQISSLPKRSLVNGA